MFKTSSLGYKLLNGKLKKHSEQLNKFVAGLFDSDGCVGVKFNSHGNSSYDNEENTYTISLCLQIDQSASNDMDLRMMRALHAHYGIGVISYRARDNWAHQATWSMGLKDAKVFYNLIGKHMQVKATHVDNMIWLVEELKTIVLTSKQTDELKSYSICSRDNSRPLKDGKHISRAYLAGLIAGDGWVTVSLNRPRLKNGWLCRENSMHCAIALHELDSDVLYKIQKDYGGHVNRKDKSMVSWRRGLGKENKTFAVKFCRDMQEYICLEKKYDALERIILFHEPPAETKCSNSEKRCDSPRR